MYLPFSLAGFSAGTKLQCTLYEQRVADFAARGLDAVNLGPGATKYAHKADEQISIAALEETYLALKRFLSDAT